MRSEVAPGCPVESTGCRSATVGFPAEIAPNNSWLADHTLNCGLAQQRSVASVVSKAENEPTTRSGSNRAGIRSSNWMDNGTEIGDGSAAADVYLKDRLGGCQRN